MGTAPTASYVSSRRLPVDKQARFIGEPIEVGWEQPPLVEKRPRCPDFFYWGDDTLTVEALLAEWRDYGRRGRMASNMRPEHARRAALRGSWGVGRFYFRVRTGTGRVFEIYYDRAPTSSDNRKGNWFLFRELI